MDIEDFVKSTLEQITQAVSKNDSGGNFKYHVDFKEGIAFDLAVTVSENNKKESGVGGGAKISIVNVNGGKGSSSEQAKETSSRIKFKVNTIDTSVKIGSIR